MPREQNLAFFKQWLVGMTDGDGCFTMSLHKNKNTWSFTYKISFSVSNLRALNYMKKNLGVGSITTEKNTNMACFYIGNKHSLKEIIFPIFDTYPLLTSKYYSYQIFKEALYIAENASLTKEEKNVLIFSLLEKRKVLLSLNSPVWSNNNNSLTKESICSISDVDTIISKPWLIGFVEAEGSFFFSKKDPYRLVHTFSIVQKKDEIVLRAIKYMLHIPTLVYYSERRRKNRIESVFRLQTSSSRAIENIIDYFLDAKGSHVRMKGIKSLEFKIWARSYRKHKGNFEALTKVKELIDKIRHNNRKDLK